MVLKSPKNISAKCPKGPAMDAPPRRGEPKSGGKIKVTLSNISNSGKQKQYDNTEQHDNNYDYECWVYLANQLTAMSIKVSSGAAYDFN